MPSSAPPSKHHNVKVLVAYALNCSYRGEDWRTVRELLVGSPAEYNNLYEDHLPRRLPKTFVKGETASQPSARLADDIPGLEDYDGGASLFVLPSNQVVLAVSFEFTSNIDDPGTLVALLEQTIDGKVLVRDMSPADFVHDQHARIPGLRTHAVGRSAPGSELRVMLLPERHQVVLLRDTGHGHAPSAPSVHQIVYRQRPPYSEEFARPKEPEQLNRYHLASESRDSVSWRQLLRKDGQAGDAGKVVETLAVVTPYVSLLYGHKDYVESSVILSTIHAVGTASRFRQIWHDTFVQVSRFRETKQEAAAGKQTRASLEELADSLGNLEFDLTFSVEFPLMRAMRIESYQNALHEALDLTTQAERLGEMFNQVSSSIQSEITAINVREQRRAEGKQKWNAFAASMLSILGVSVGFVIAFLGINTSEVMRGSPQISMWDARFDTLYLLAGLFALAPTYFICLPYLREWMRPHRGRDAFTFMVGPFIGVTGFVLIELAQNLVHTADSNIAIDAVLKALGIFGIAVGASLILSWGWSRIPPTRP